jgi:hypothetical protein
MVFPKGATEKPGLFPNIDREFTKRVFIAIVSR